MPKTLPNPAAVRGKETLTVEDVAVLIGCGRTVAYRLSRRGTLRWAKPFKTFAVKGIDERKSQRLHRGVQKIRC